MGKLILSNGKYTPALDLRATEKAVKLIKDNFEKNLSRALNLERVSAPLFVRPESGLNDNLNGVERAVGFDIKDIGADVEIVHSLAKWKRMALKRYNFNIGEGLYTDMNAIRRDEELDNLHSVYVDQWDWEKVIAFEDRKIETLKDIVCSIVKAIKETQNIVCKEFANVTDTISDKVFFITTQELLDMYPEKTAKEREDLICKEKKTVFIMQIGDKLSNGEKHDGRAPDYDDWSLNGDIMFYNEILDHAFEISSMGIRVDEIALENQLKKAGCEERRDMPFHKALLAGELPYTVGGGIGQSRLCMLLLQKVHIGEVQASVWDDEMLAECEKQNIAIL